jgi:methionyl-tRNA formyltransferase
MRKEDIRIIFMGTPDFAVTSLKTLIENNCNIVAVVTSPDKPAGRGQKIRESAVKQYAVAKKLPVLQPEKLKAPSFIRQINNLKPDLQIVVAFRMLPEAVWKIPSKGTFNLHASLLPQYRGAAPINHVIINGEKETGVTTFLIDDKIDTGQILLQRKTAILDTDTAGSLHDRLMPLGAELVLETIEKIAANNIKPVPQDQFNIPGNELKTAPKISKEDCRINWHDDIYLINQFIKGLSPFPGAWTTLFNGNDTIIMKILNSDSLPAKHKHPDGTILTDNKKTLHIAVNNGYIAILNLQLAGKRKLPVADLLRGFTFHSGAIVK